MYVKLVESYTDFDKLSHVIQRGLRGFTVKHIEGKSTEESDLSLIFIEVDLLRK